MSPVMLDPISEQRTSLDVLSRIEIEAAWSAAEAGTITEVEVSQQVAPRNARRDLLVIKNPSNTDEPLFCNLGAAAAIDDSCPSLEPGESLVLEAAFPSESIHLTAETEGHRYVVLIGQRGGIE